MKKNNLIFLLFIAISWLFLFYEIIFYNNSVLADDSGRDLSVLNKADKLMIVAHADDDLLWGGKHLIKDDYVVVCVTCGTNELREKEFENAMALTNDYHLSLGYIEVVNGHAANWRKEYPIIAEELSRIVNYKKWDMIVTHNPDGEYGHRHHRWVSRMVTNSSSKVNLYYFDKYHLNRDEDVFLSIEDLDLLKKKEEYLNVYESQSAIVNNHRNSIVYENFISYFDWDNTKITEEVK